MKTTHSLLLATLLAFFLVACGSPTTPSVPESTAEPIILPISEPQAISISDPALEAMVRAALGKPEGSISVSDARAVTRLDLSNEWQPFLSADTTIHDIQGLEQFSNLEYLDLSWHAITNISALKELTKLTFLSLGGNPIQEIDPLANLTNLKVLNLSHSEAKDYNPLGSLIHLEYLKLNNSSITDASPLLPLTNLHYLYLEQSEIKDLSSLLQIYPNLEERDFVIASTLEEIGFWMDGNIHMAIFESADAFVKINHLKWGNPPMEWESNMIEAPMYMENGAKLGVISYPLIKAYAISINKEGEPQINYVFDQANDDLSVSSSDREIAERLISEGLSVNEGEDPLLAPVRVFEDNIQKTFKMSADALFDLPFAPITLKTLYFRPDLANAVVLYEWRNGKDVNIEVHRPEWGEKDFDVRFFTPISDEYRIVVTYISEQKRFGVGVDDNDMGGVFFEYFPETQEIIDQYCSDKDLTVEEYLVKAYNDPTIENVYLHSVELMESFILQTFGLTVDELFKLPTGEYSEVKTE